MDATVSNPANTLFGLQRIQEMSHLRRQVAAARCFLLKKSSAMIEQDGPCEGTADPSARCDPCLTDINTHSSALVPPQASGPRATASASHRRRFCLPHLRYRRHRTPQETIRRASLLCRELVAVKKKVSQNVSGWQTFNSAIMAPVASSSLSVT